MWIDVEIEDVVIDFCEVGVCDEIDIVGVDDGDFYRCFGIFW